MCRNVKRHYPSLLANDVEWASRAEATAQRTFELTSFLTDVRKITSVDVDFPKKRDLSRQLLGLAELGVRQQPRALLRSIPGLELKEAAQGEVCCGFGGLFCMKYSEISNRMVSEKCDAVTATGAKVLLGGDLGCPHERRANCRGLAPQSRCGTWRRCSQATSPEPRYACPRTRKMNEAHADFLSRSNQALANPALRQALENIQTHLVEGRRAAVARVPEFEQLRSRAAAIKDHVLSNLDVYLELFATQVQSAGGKVHWAVDAEEAGIRIAEICRAAKARSVVKAKSMISEEIELNDHLGIGWP